MSSSPERVVKRASWRERERERERDREGARAEVWSIVSVRKRCRVTLAPSLARTPLPSSSFSSAIHLIPRFSVDSENTSFFGLQTRENTNVLQSGFRKHCSLTSPTAL
ncbi:hypothetical protein AOLI_G00318150 [Acnodon oligacanthus]